MIDHIRQIIQRHGRLAGDSTTLAADTNLYQAGLTSYASVTVMLALEETFSIEFPERMLRRQTFETMANIQDAVTELIRSRPLDHPARIS